MSALDDILNFGIPALLILVVLGFVYIKLLEPYLVPLLVKLWGKITARNEERKVYGKDIIYE